MDVTKLPVGEKFQKMANEQYPHDTDRGAANRMAKRCVSFADETAEKLKRKPDRNADDEDLLKKCQKISDNKIEDEKKDIKILIG